MLFGAYDPVVTNLSTPRDGSAVLTTNCSTGSSPVITLGQGTNNNTATSTDAVPVRRMVHGSIGTAFLSYQLYQVSPATTVWGNTSGTAPPAVTGTGTNQNFTVYGRITEGQNQPVGSYSDTVVATVTF